MYDGLNLFAQDENLQPLSSFTEPELGRFARVEYPHAVQAAARQGLAYMRNYHTKYVLAPERRMCSEEAVCVLQGLVLAA
jgi:hypothetical protein